MLEALGNQTRVDGWRRHGWNMLLNFREELPEGGVPTGGVTTGGLLFAPNRSLTSI